MTNSRGKKYIAKHSCITHHESMKLSNNLRHHLTDAEFSKNGKKNQGYHILGKWTFRYFTGRSISQQSYFHTKSAGTHCPTIYLPEISLRKISLIGILTIWVVKNWRWPTHFWERGNIRSLLKCLSRWLLPWLAQFYNCGPPCHSLTPILVVFLHSIFHHLNVVFYSHMLSVTCFSPIRFIIQLRQDFQDFLTSEFSESTVGILGWCHTHMVEVPSPGASVKKTLQTFLLYLARPSWQRPWGSC